MKFQGRNVVITGGSSGFGLSAAKMFAQQGARVAILGRTQSKLDTALSQLGGAHLAIQADVGDLSSLKRAFDEIKDSMGHIHHLVANAGISIYRDLQEVDEAFFDRHFNTNVKGLFFTVQLGQRLFPNSGGTVVLTSSCVQHMGISGYSVYSATKAAIRSLGRTLASELITKGVRVNVLSPGAADTPILDGLQMDEMRLAAVAECLPIKRFASADEVGQAILYLSSDEASYMVGSELLVDGGMSTLGLRF